MDKKEIKVTKLSYLFNFHKKNPVHHSDSFVQLPEIHRNFD